MGGNGILRTPGLYQDGHQFFVKLAYLVKF
jgi:hypothetical protein